MSHPFFPKKREPIVLELRLRRVIAPACIGLLLYILYEQTILHAPFTLERQVETVAGVLVLYYIASIPTIPINIGSKEE